MFIKCLYYNNLMLLKVAWAGGGVIIIIILVLVTQSFYLECVCCVEITSSRESIAHVEM
jgi:hypothetical protein